MPSTIRDRINSFEAASSLQGGVPSPSRPIASISPRGGALGTKRDAFKLPHYEGEHRHQQNEKEENKPQSATKQPKPHRFRNRNRETQSRSKFYRDMKNANNNAETALSDVNTNSSGNNNKNNPTSASNRERGNRMSHNEGNQPFEETSSTTATASENRRSRIRQSQQQIRENSISATTTNFTDLRRQRRMLQNQRRTYQAPSNDSSTAAAKSQDIDQSEASTTMFGRENLASTVPDSPGRTSTASSSLNIASSSPGGSRWSKLSRLQRRPNGINERQSSIATNTTRNSGYSAVTSVVRNTTSDNATSKHLSPVKLENVSAASPNTKSMTISKLMSATAGLSTKTRRQNEEVSSPSISTSRHSNRNRKESDDNNDNNGTNLRSPRSHRDDSSDIGGAASPQQINASLEAPTDDDATLTSVHRIMEGSNNSNHHRTTIDNSNNHHPNSHQNSVNYTYEPLQSNHNPSTSGRDSGSVGPSWKPNRGVHSNSNRNTIWKEDEKSDKIGYGLGGRVLRTEYSSDYDMDDISKADRSRHSVHSVDGPSTSQATDANDFLISSRYNNSNAINSGLNNNNNSAATMGTKRIDDDDRTFDYGDRDDDSNGGTSFARRRREADQRRARLAAQNDLNSNNNGSIVHNNQLGQSIHQGGGSIIGNNGEPKLLSKEEMEHFTAKDNPALRLSAGVAAVATVGLAVAGPAGLLIGVAAGGLGFGFMQIPEDERIKIQDRAEKAMNTLQEKACDASEAVTSSCLSTYEDSGVAEHVPHCLSSNIADQLVPNCPTGQTAKSENLFNPAGATAPAGSQMTGPHSAGTNHQEHPSASPAGPMMEQPKAAPMSHNERMRNKKVACLRNVRILPIAQIHGLDPTSQPRAWLDVVASANTSNDQKNEAMEEILLLAKDKRRAKIFLDEGILDYIIWTISRYLEKLEAADKKTDWAFPEITANEKSAANLAALCCVTLGKAHCAAIHTEGDLLLMSMYERGTVPEERQVAQMLHEVPHHARVTKISDPTIVEPSKEVFAPRQLTLAQAEELARSIKAVADGQM